MELPSNYNYIGAFLTYDCNLNCGYCITRHNSIPVSDIISGKEWIEILNKIPANNDMPITLQGGEPTLHPFFYDIVNGVDKPMDLLTNLQFDVEEFMENVSVHKFYRDAPYASIRVSFHPMQTSVSKLLGKLLALQMNGYQAGVYCIDHPNYVAHNWKLKECCDTLGIECRFKDFLGMLDGRLYGEYKYEGAIGEKVTRKCLCKTSELLISPNGDVFTCHSHLYNNRVPWGNIMQEDFEPVNRHIPCYYYGNCNPCDVKVTTNRYQQFGHTSVDIINIENNS